MASLDEMKEMARQDILESLAEARTALSTDPAAARTALDEIVSMVGECGLDGDESISAAVSALAGDTDAIAAAEAGTRRLGVDGTSTSGGPPVNTSSTPPCDGCVRWC